MSKFVIAPHMRLHEWVAEEKGYFADEGLDYEFRPQLQRDDERSKELDGKDGAYQTFERGRTCDVSSACHWTVNMAAAAGHGLLYNKAYSVSPCAVFVAPDSGIERPEDLAGVPISVGYQSGSHYSTIEALDMFLDPADIELSFHEGLLFQRMEALYDGTVPAVSVFSGPYYFLEQSGFRKVVDTSFMMASMVDEGADMEDVDKFFRALRRAQTDIDLHAHRYTHYYKNEFPARFHDKMDTRLFGPGERIVFEPYTSEIYHDTQKWILERGIFDQGNPISREYGAAVVSQAAE
jgi:ABC-type nitrate/sulfonate/bicarbonate transport system substrate-binding protein